MYSIYTEQQNKGNKLHSNWAPVASRFKSPWLGWVHCAPRLHHPPWFASSPFSVVPTSSSSSFSPSCRFAHLLPVSLFLHVFSALPHRHFPHLRHCVCPPTHPRGCLTLRIRPSVTSSPLPLSSSSPLPLLLLSPLPLLLLLPLSFLFSSPPFLSFSSPRPLSLSSISPLWIVKMNHDKCRGSCFVIHHWALPLHGPPLLPSSPDPLLSDAKLPTSLWKGEGRLRLHPRF